MSGRRACVVLFALLSCAMGCAPGGETADEDVDDDYENTGEATGAIVTGNAMTPNSMTPNSMTPNSMTPNALAPDTLAAGHMAALQAATADGALARSFVKYLVGCALSSSQAFAFSWTDADGVIHNESYPGLLGLAPEWATGALVKNKHKRLVSGCLAARVNYYGTPVLISARSHDPPLKPQAEEVADYKYVEGVFWGNLFTSRPYLNACYDEDNIEHSRQAKRDCAVGHLSGGSTVPCGMIQLQGACKNLCTKIDGGGQFYPDCIDQPGTEHTSKTKAVITTVLP